MATIKMDLSEGSGDGRRRVGPSRAIVAVALVLLAATYFLLSPPAEHEGYAGAIPWRDLSVLRPLTRLMSLGGGVSTQRGVEIKDFAFHLAAGVGLLVLAWRLAWADERDLRTRRVKGAWFYAQVFLTGWVLLSAASAFWSGDPEISLSQAALYGLALCWAIALAWTLQNWDVPKLLGGLVIISATGAGLCVWYYYERNPFHRPGFPIGNPASLASCILPAILVVCCALADAGQRWRRERQLPALLLMGCAAALVPLLWCFALTKSRAAMAGLIVGVGTILFLQARRWVRWGILAAVAILMAGGLWMAYFGHLDLGADRAATLRLRFYAWRYAADLWRQRPISGAGAGAYARLAGQFGVNERALDPAAFLGDWIGHAHNELFEVLAEIGLVGGVTFVGGFVATFAGALALLRMRLPNRQRWLLIGLIAGLMAQITDLMGGVGLRLPGVPAVFYTLLGTLWAACRCAARDEAATEIGGESASSVPAGSVSQTAPAISTATGSGPAGSDFDAADLQSTLHSLTRKPAPAQKTALAALTLLCAAGAVGLAVRAWSGALREQAAYLEYGQGRYAEALENARLAETRLLDPLRKIYADEFGLRCRFELAQAAYERAAEQYAKSGAASAPVSSRADNGDARGAAIDLCENAYIWAWQLEQRAPTLLRTAAVGARCAEMLADLYAAAGEPRRPLEWRQRAAQAWSLQRVNNPYDVETLLALTRYPGTLDEHVALLRDALRGGFPDAQWFTALQRLATVPRFEEMLALYVQAAGPIDPQTHADSIVLSLAPEAYRLNAAWQALRGNLDEAQRDAGRAASLYQPLMGRFPTLYSVALTERADYLLRANPENAAAAVELLRDALAALPSIQEQKFDVMARPFRLQLARGLLAAGREDEAAAVLRQAFGWAETPEQDEGQDAARMSRTLADTYVRLAEPFLRALGRDKQKPAEVPAAVQAWLDAALRRQPHHVSAWSARAWLAARRDDAEAVKTVLKQAAAAGVRPEDVRRIRNGVAQEFPALREKLAE